MTTKSLVSECLAELEAIPEAATLLAILRCDLRRTSEPTKQHRIWKRFVESLSGRSLTELANNDHSKLNFYRALFAELNAQAKPQVRQLAMEI